MTLHDKQRFKQAFNRLAVAVRLPAEQADTAMQKVYWDGLEPFPIDAVESAATSIAKAAVWFPKLAEWRDAAGAAQNVQAMARALPSVGREWHAECATCHDTGWEPLSCAGTRQCGREKTHQEHQYAVACACRPTNHTYQRRMAEQRERVRGRSRAES